MTNDNLKWYALKVTANKERKVKEHIDKKIKIESLSDAIVNVVVPTEKYLSLSVNGKKSVREKLILPGYLLINADMKHGEVKPMLEKVSGVYGFLNMDDRTDVPIHMRDREVDRFLKVYEEQEEITWDFQAGDNVKLLDGPFSGFEGVIQNMDTNKKIANIMVMIFGRETAVEISLSMIEKVGVKKRV